MGLLVQGAWHDRWYDTTKTRGRFLRQDTQFRSWVTPDGAAGPTGEGGFKAEPGRYHLYVSLACPWAHRTLIFRRLKGLDRHVPLSVVNPDMGGRGWTFDDAPSVIPDPFFNDTATTEIYTAAEPNYTGRVTVPVLWDRERSTIVSNESSEIIRMFNSAFDALPEVDTRYDYSPERIRPLIDALNGVIYDNINNGVYKAGFATTQEAYDEAVQALFQTLDHLEERLSKLRYLMGPEPTEADFRLLTTLLRFDLVYHGHFKCNRRRLVDHPNLWAYTRELYQIPAVRWTTDFDHIVSHYHRSHASINPAGIVPVGPDLDFDAPHGREHLEGRPPWPANDR
jgi:putative glutathione S-transferase